MNTQDFRSVYFNLFLNVTPGTDEYLTRVCWKCIVFLFLLEIPYKWQRRTSSELERKRVLSELDLVSEFCFVFFFTDREHWNAKECKL